MEKILNARALPMPLSHVAPTVQRPWKPRIPEIIKDLRTLAAPYVSRTDIEGKLEIARSQADRVMRQVGMVKASEVGVSGKLNLVSVAEFILWLQVHYDEPARKEHDRIEKLQKKLQDARDEQKQKKAGSITFKDKKQASKVVAGPIENIPGVTLQPPMNGQPGEFRILFVNTVDFLGKLHLWGWSAVNQEEKLNRMTTPIEAAPQNSFGFEQSGDEAPARTGGTPLAGEGKARSNG